jgi:hypothetical protein
MTRWIKTALVGTAVALGILLPASAALADPPAASPDDGTITLQVPTN